MNFFKHLVALTIVLIVTVLTGMMLLIVETWRNCESGDMPMLYAAVVLGSDSGTSDLTPDIEARLDKAVELYENEKAYYFILSGGRLPDLPENPNDEKPDAEKSDNDSQGKPALLSPTEADAMKTYLLSRGIPEEHLILENQSTSTIENIHYSKLIIDSLECDAVYLITGKPELCRALLIAQQGGIETLGIPAEVSGGFSNLFFQSAREAFKLVYYFLVEQWEIPDMDEESVEPDINIRYTEAR
jgi:uncharacterized SAM-binding protein YcdF (DUF218 family)